MKTLVIKLAKRYIVNTVQEAIEANKGNVTIWAKKIGVWLARIRLATAFLERLATRLSDGVLSDEESATSVKELKVLADQVTAKVEIEDAEEV